MKNVDEQKKKLKQKKNRLAAEETKLKLQERKARTRHLIENGGLITKAGINHLPSNALYGALLSLKEQLDKKEEIMAAWTVKGNDAFNAEQKLTTPVILTFDNQPEKVIRDSIRSLGMRWNRFRNEWYGNVADVDSLKKELADTKHTMEEIQSDNNQ